MKLAIWFLGFLFGLCLDTNNYWEMILTFLLGIVLMNTREINEEKRGVKNG